MKITTTKGRLGRSEESIFKNLLYVDLIDPMPVRLLEQSED
jgi:hypothetical protein